jgi:hypothetical protein
LRDFSNVTDKAHAFTPTIPAPLRNNIHFNDVRVKRELENLIRVEEIGFELLQQNDAAQ